MYFAIRYYTQMGLAAYFMVRFFIKINQNELVDYHWVIHDQIIRDDKETYGFYKKHEGCVPFVSSKRDETQLEHKKSC